jgi:hypothetical protein
MLAKISSADPDEGLWIAIVLVDEFADCLFKLRRIPMRTTSGPPAVGRCLTGTGGSGAWGERPLDAESLHASL